MSRRKIILDYRNGKYIGEALNRLHDGLGVFTDENWCTCIGNWQNNKLNGACVIIMPQYGIYYGQIYKNKQIGVCFYALGKKCYIIGHFLQKIYKTKVAIVFEQISTIIEAEYEKKFQVNEQYTYNSQQEKWKIVERCIGASVKQNHKNVISYIKSQLQNVLVVKKNDEIFIGLIGETLAVKLDIVYKTVVGIGHYSHEGELIGIGWKKMEDIGGQYVQQGDYNDKSTLVCYQKDRPKKAVKNLQNNFQKSLQFINEFYKNEDIHNIWGFSQDIFQSLKTPAMQRYAQLLLENPKKPKIQPPQDTHQVSRIYSIEKVKQDIYKSVSKRNQSHINQKVSQIYKNYHQNRFTSKSKTPERKVTFGMNNDDYQLKNNYREQNNQIQPYYHKNYLEQQPLSQPKSPVYFKSNNRNNPEVQKKKSSSPKLEKPNQNNLKYIYKNKYQQPQKILDNFKKSPMKRNEIIPKIKTHQKQYDQIEKRQQYIKKETPKPFKNTYFQNQTNDFNQFQRISPLHSNSQSPIKHKQQQRTYRKLNFDQYQKYPITKQVLKAKQSDRKNDSYHQKYLLRKQVLNQRDKKSVSPLKNMQIIQKQRYQYLNEQKNNLKPKDFQNKEYQQKFYQNYKKQPYKMREQIERQRNTEYKPRKVYKYIDDSQ